MTKSLAIIPARGGSKRIPQKNMKLFLDKPIIEYSINAALQCSHIDRVIVSTDDPKIAEIAKNAGADVPFMRSNDNSSDYAGLSEVALEVLEQLDSQGDKYDNFCLILATAPFISNKSLNESFNLLSDSKSDAIIPVVQYSFPIQRAFKVSKQKLEMFSPENMKVRSQDLEPAYHDAGQYYWLKTDSFLKEKKIYLNNSTPYILEERYSQDIDTPEDWLIAEMKFKMMLSEEHLKD
jgi:pseudaminic acid cytidylyltransferase